jgi:hypothetical protein
MLVAQVTGWIELAGRVKHLFSRCGPYASNKFDMPEIDPERLMKISSLLLILSHICVCDYRQCMNWMLNLLTTCIRHSELHFTDH